MKKIALIVMSVLVAFNLVMPPEVAKANIATKPITIAAKKVAKDLAKNTAVEMANQIVSDYLVRDLIEGVKTDEGYSPVCMDSKKDNIKDCTADKRAQIKTTLTSVDKTKLEKTVESVLEKKTNTSSKWTKFLDFFVPIFLISGAVSFFSASLDGDILSFFDEIAQESLIESGLLKPLSMTSRATFVPKDFSEFVQSARVSVIPKPGYFSVQTQLDIQLKPSKTLLITVNDKKMSMSGSFSVVIGTNVMVEDIKGSNPPQSFVYAKYYNLNFSDNTPFFYSDGILDATVYQGTPVAKPSVDLNLPNVATLLTSLYVAKTADINDVLNTFFSNISMYFPLTIEVPDLKVEQVKTDYGTQTATEKIKNPDGTVNMKGMNSFTFKYGDTHIYPSVDSQTGWKDKITGEDIPVVEDEITVDDDATTVEEEETEVPPSCPKLKKPDFKAFTKSFTTAFPFSIPWDIGRAIDAAFGGIGSKKPEFDLNPLIPAKLTIPDYFDSWMPFVRTIILLAFDAGLIYLFARFMGRGGGD